MSAETSAMSEETSGETHSTFQQAQETAGQVAQQAWRQTSSVLETQRGRAAQSLTAMGQALRQSGQELRRSDMGPMGQVPERLADQVDTVAGYVSSRSVDELIADAEQFARDNPALFVAGTVALGVFIARFLKSSSASSAGGSDGR
jgi:hypothetical protein